MRAPARWVPNRGRERTGAQSLWFNNRVAELPARRSGTRARLAVEECVLALELLRLLGRLLQQCLALAIASHGPTRAVIRPRLSVRQGSITTCLFEHLTTGHRSLTDCRPLFGRLWLAQTENRFDQIAARESEQQEKQPKERLTRLHLRSALALHRSLSAP